MSAQPRLALYLRTVMVIASLALFAGVTWPMQSDQLGKHNLISSALPDTSHLPGVPLVFEPNVGQTDPSVRFVTRVPGGTHFFTLSEVVMSLQPPREADKAHDALSPGAPSVVRMSFVGASPLATLTQGSPSPAKVSYFLGNDPALWHADTPAYGSVLYSGLYEGIDLRYEGTSSRLKGTYTVTAGADPTQIRWRYSGAQSVTLDGAALRIGVGSADGSARQVLIEDAPIAWQEVGGQRVPVTARYALAPDGTASLALGDYDRALPLIIDPTLTYSSYLGGNWAEYGYGIAADAEGNFYVSGMTNSENFPLVNPYQSVMHGYYNAYVAKFNPLGQPVYITYLGGSSTTDGAFDIAVDSDGNAYVTGFTIANDFPTANAFQPQIGGSYDAFVTKLNPSGSALLFSTYLGGSGEENSGGSGPLFGSIALDPARNVYVTATPLPTTSRCRILYSRAVLPCRTLSSRNSTPADPPSPGPLTWAALTPTGRMESE
jgi:hypothetical protein